MQKLLSEIGRTGRTIVFSVFALFIAAGVAQAATTISTNISTDGTLSTTGLATLLGGATTTQITLLSGDTIKNTTASTTLVSGALQSTGGFTATTGSFTSTLGVTGLSSLAFASSTLFSANSAYFGATATSTFSSAGALTLIADLTLQNGEVISNSTNGTVSIGGASDVVKVLGTASTSALKVGDEPATPTVNGMVFGYCSFGNVTLAASSTDGFASCTTVPAGALVAGDRVFVQATSSFDQAFIITAASTTGASTIQLRIMNTGLGGEDGTLGGTSVNFWALR